ncbi:MAG TPA: hypothetical protein VIL69_15190 [Roseomonas sp.]|jgi:hypothetical protein
MPHRRPAADLGVGDVFLVTPGGAFPHDRILVCQVVGLRGERLRARVLDGRWTATSGSRRRAARSMRAAETKSLTEAAG